MHVESDDQACPHCYKVMIALATFDPCDDLLGPGLDDPAAAAYGGFYGQSAFSAFGLLDAAREWLGAKLLRRRLARICRLYPRSMYCSGCGYIDRRR